MKYLIILILGIFIGEGVSSFIQNQPVHEKYTVNAYGTRGEDYSGVITDDEGGLTLQLFSSERDTINVLIQKK
jgi:hypothetical protein